MKKYSIWMVLVVVVSMVFATVYVSLQQNIRMEANSQPVQVAHDLAAALSSDTAAGVLHGSQVDMRSSLSTFVILYDANGSPVTGTGFLDGVQPRIPRGVLQHAVNAYDNRITWQPADDVRIASVAVAAPNNQFVVAGRNLRDAEKRADQLLWLNSLSWFVSVLVIAGGYLLMNGKLTKLAKSKKK